MTTGLQEDQRQLQIKKEPDDLVHYSVPMHRKSRAIEQTETKDMGNKTC